MKKLMLFFIFNSILYAHTFTVDADIDIRGTSCVIAGDYVYPATAVKVGDEIKVTVDNDNIEEHLDEGVVIKIGGYVFEQ